MSQRNNCHTASAHPRSYSQRLGMLSPAQFQQALDTFGLGKFVGAEPITQGLFGQNAFLSSSSGDFVLRGCPHFEWQFPAEKYFVDLLGHPEIDLSRLFVVYSEAGRTDLAHTFLNAYNPGILDREDFRRRFPLFMLHDRALIWEWIQRNDSAWWDKNMPLREWLAAYLL